MVDFTLTDEQIALREMAHDFAEKEIRPVAWEFDKEGTWPQEILEKAWELGLMNAHVPRRLRRSRRRPTSRVVSSRRSSAGAARASAPRSAPTASPPRRSRSAALRR